MIEQQCFCGEVTYQVFSEYAPLQSEHDNLRFVNAVGLTIDPNKMIHRYVKKVGGAFEHAFCSQCGCPIYQIDHNGHTKYCIWQTSTVPGSLYSGAMQFGL